MALLHFKLSSRPQTLFPGTVSMRWAIVKQFSFFRVWSHCKELATWALMKY